MKFLSIVWLASVSNAFTPVSRDGKASFDGFKVYKVDTKDRLNELNSVFEGLSVIELNHNDATVDIAVAPEHLEAFDTLNFTSTILSEDLGADIAAEGSLASYPGLWSFLDITLLVTKQTVDLDEDGVPSLSWFDSYHAYEDHIQYWSDLQAAFPDNSELIQVGPSFEGRQIQGIHLWGSGGKDSKPAIFFNGNVHAREWITSKVFRVKLSKLLGSLLVY